MATIITDNRDKTRIYNDRPEFRDTESPFDLDIDQARADSIPDIESDPGLLSPELEPAVNQALKSDLVKKKIW